MQVYESTGIKSIYNFEATETEPIVVHENPNIIEDDIKPKEARKRFNETKASSENQIQPESIQERIKRIQWEINDLEDLVKKKENSKYQNDVVSLQSMLKKLTVDETVGSFNKLLNEIKEYKSRTISEQVKSDKMVYEIAYDPTFPNELESRVTKLERIIGLHAIDPLKLALDQGTLVGTLDRVDHQISLLTNPKTLDQASKRILECSNHLKELIKLKKEYKVELGLQRNEKLPPSITLDEKTTFLYNQMIKLESTANLLPNIISRLKSLKSLHGEACLFNEMIQDLKEQEIVLNTLAKELKLGIEQLTESFNINRIQITENIMELNQRINKLTKK